MTKKRAALVAVFVLSWTSDSGLARFKRPKTRSPLQRQAKRFITASSALIAPETIPQQATSLDATGELEAPAPVPPANRNFPLPTPTPNVDRYPPRQPRQRRGRTPPTPTETPTETYTPTITCTFTPTPTFTRDAPTFTPTPTNTPTPMGLTYFLKQLVDLDRLAVLEEEGGHFRAVLEL